MHDHHALSAALKNGETRIVFVFDKKILSKLKNPADPRLSFIMDSLIDMEKNMILHGAGLIIRFGDPVIEIPKLASELNINALFFNRDYEPYAKKRDSEVSKKMLKKGIFVHTFKDHVFFEKEEVKTGSQEIYKVFTPYKRKWLEKLERQDCFIPNYKCQLKNLAKGSIGDSPLEVDWFKVIHFRRAKTIFSGGSSEARKCLLNFKKNISKYKESRDFPALNLTSRLSPYLRMGNLSIRDMLRLALLKKDAGSETWLSELIWRDFYQVILDAYPQVEKHCFKEEYDKICWSGPTAHFHKWCQGMTGYPIIDAAMRCLNATGLMHNRLRMVVASFLTKTLLVDWRSGERYFAEKLLDYDMAANNGGWQWAASTGVDAQPYFRIFNPYNQSEKFDAEGIFIKTWCPELALFPKNLIHYPHESDLSEQAKAHCFIGRDYPAPIVSYRDQKAKALAMYKKIK